MFTKTARTRLAAALAFGGLALAAPAMAAPLSRDAGLQQGSGEVQTVQYGHGYGHRHGGWGHHGFGPRHHHHGGWGRGHHYGWRHHGFGPRHHHHGGWGHRHGHGRW
ncbi:hypothetical protein GOFOIKOB_0729 [Methylobacterium tardum]|jgi:hypothetical protein|uniref:Uncharacterized protein n=1 Tax=Methylobacterium tardum TaxID=374432 RepID=A0AA37TAA0_9HYPH|nr:hypothetical protein [Methylobacterium tardum]URD36266.1 hypothetical protein M6G65_28455 [Methylobacterium tardum]GJE47704.1 hypothetical protein GOFOIKOB_0729 [Methylobacterium tardum]GLS69659.1 hypothetical protein GCM10007890_16720 [Methylobacterium tardum]